MLPDGAHQVFFSLTIRYLTLSESFFFSLVFSVNLRNCILILLRTHKTLKKHLVFYLDFVFVVNLLIHKIIYSVFKVLSVLLSTSGGPGWTRTTGLTLIRRAL